MSITYSYKFAAFAVVLLSVSLGWARAEDKPENQPVVAPGVTLDENWERLDPRCEFLLMRLVVVETVLEEIEKRQHAGYWRRKKKEVEVKVADKEIVEQYRNGGGPKRWYRFYGENIDSFYQPGQGRAAAIFDSWGNPRGVSVTQGKAQLKKRPPQFDYIEKAQEKIKADAAREAGALSKQIDELDARRKELELEQIELWCQIAFREVQRRDLAQKAFYRFDPKPIDPSSDASQHMEAMRVAVTLMSQVVRIVDTAGDDRAKTLQRIAATVKGARVNLSDTWQRNGVLPVTLTNDQYDITTNRGRFISLAKLLEDLGSNVEESYAGATKAADSTDESKLEEKQRVWEQLTKSLMRFAAVVLAMDESAAALAQEWKLQPDLDTKLTIEVEESTAELPEKPGDTLLGLREIRLKGKGGRVMSHAVTYDAGVTYIARGDGSKAPLTLENRSLTWTAPKGIKKTVNVDHPGPEAELVYDDGRAPAIDESQSPTTDTDEPQPKRRGKKKSGNKNR